MKSLRRGRGRRSGHTHEYVAHPNPEWASHYACRVCGFAVLRRLVDASVPHLVVKTA